MAEKYARGWEIFLSASALFFRNHCCADCRSTMNLHTKDIKNKSRKPKILPERWRCLPPRFKSSAVVGHYEWMLTAGRADFEVVPPHSPNPDSPPQTIA